MVNPLSNVVVQFKRQHEASMRGLDGGGGPPHDEDMEKRVSQLEAAMPNLATKADVEALRGDLHKMDASIVRWMIATVLTLFLGFAGLFFTMQSSIHAGLSRLVQPTPSPSHSSPPIIIQLPAQAAAPPGSPNLPPQKP